MPPLTIMVKPVSGLCNMRCSYCFYSDEMSRRDVALRGRMNEQTLENLVRRAFAYAENHLMLAFQGGEPTLAGAEFFRKLVELEQVYNRRGVPITHAIQTNGLALSDELLDIFQKHHFLVGVSLDGSRETHDACRMDASGRGTYDRVLQTIARLKARKIEYNILCVVNQTVAAQPDAVFHALRKHTYLQFIPCLDPLDGGQNAKSLSAEAYGRFLIAIFKHYRQAFQKKQALSIRLFDDWLRMLIGQPPGECGFFGKCTPHFLLESDGSVYPCDFYALDEWQMGNINEHSFFRIRKSAVRDAFIQAQIDPECHTCPWRRFCRYGCRRDRVTDGEPSKSRWCVSYKMFFEACWDNLRQLADTLRGKV